MNVEILHEKFIFEEFSLDYYLFDTMITANYLLENKIDEISDIKFYNLDVVIEIILNKKSYFFMDFNLDFLNNLAKIELLRPYLLEFCRHNHLPGYFETEKYIYLATLFIGK